jgi:F-type H+-transporting ATPase subunit b
MLACNRVLFGGPLVRSWTLISLSALLLVAVAPLSPAWAVQDEAAGSGEVDAAAADAEPQNEEESSEAAHGGDDHGEGDHGEAGEEPVLLRIDPGSAVWNLLIFLAVLLILGLFVWPKILDGLQAREDKVRADLVAAAEANKQAEANLAEYQRRLDEAQTQVQQLLAEARDDAEAAGAKIVAEAKADADRQRQRALADIETAKAVAIGELADQTSEITLALARKVVGRELNPSDHAELIRQSLEKLPSRN